MEVKVVMVDDLDLHRNMSKGSLASLSAEVPEYTFIAHKECVDGKDVLECGSYREAALITLDIRMPEIDGLTALLFLRRKYNCRAPICMVSSEQESNINRFVGDIPDKLKNMPYETKLQHMSKVEERVLSGVTEAGKINDLLSGCEKLMVDPRKYAMHLGANGFLTKPYDMNQVKSVLVEVINGKTVCF